MTKTGTIGWAGTVLSYNLKHKINIHESRLIQIGC